MPNFQEYPKTMFKRGDRPVVAVNSAIERILVDRGWSTEPVSDDAEDDPVVVDPDLSTPYLTINGVKVRPFQTPVGGRTKVGWEQEVNGSWVETSSRVL